VTDTSARRRSLFYDGLALHHHVLCESWERSSTEQGQALSALLHEAG
jgi:hypothetical protein